MNHKLILSLFQFWIVLVLCGCSHDVNQQTQIFSFGNDQLDGAIRGYLQTQPDFSWQTVEGSKNICVFDKLDDNDLFPHYLWVYCQEYIWENGKLKELSGASLPAKIDYPNELSFFDITRFTHEIPGNGTDYPIDIRKIFPDDIENLALSYDAGAISLHIQQVAKDEMATMVTE